MDNVLDILKVIAALVNVVFGLYSLVQTRQIADASHITLDDGRGKAEIRIAFGGFFLAFGLAALILNDPAAYRLLGIGYLGAAMTRLASLAVDDPKHLLDRSYVGLGFTEFLIGLVLLL